jgi:hypothetical protein
MKLDKEVTSTNSAEREKTVLEQVFTLFCSKDEMRPLFLKPFVLGDKTYATDGYTLVRCDSGRIDFEFENNEKPKDVSSAIPDANTSEIINLDNIDWVGLMKEDEIIKVGEELVCGHCGGDGECEDDLSYKSKSYFFKYNCPVCDGSGYEVEKRKVPSGNKTFKDFDMIRLRGVLFYATKFYRLKQVKDLVGGEVELIYYPDGKSKYTVLFRIGFLEILIMPGHEHGVSKEDVVASV